MLTLSLPKQISGKHNESGDKVIVYHVTALLPLRLFWKRNMQINVTGNSYHSSRQIRSFFFSCFSPFFLPFLFLLLLNQSLSVTKAICVPKTYHFTCLACQVNLIPQEENRIFPEE